MIVDTSESESPEYFDFSFGELWLTYVPLTNSEHKYNNGLRSRSKKLPLKIWQADHWNAAL